MKYIIKSTNKEVNIEVNETIGKQSLLLKAFQECQEGRCSCPTEEYKKLDSLEIDNSVDTIHLKLKSKPGLQIDETEIDKCLEYTRDKVNDKK